MGPPRLHYRLSPRVALRLPFLLPSLRLVTPPLLLVRSVTPIPVRPVHDRRHWYPESRRNRGRWRPSIHYRLRHLQANLRRPFPTPGGLPRAGTLSCLGLHSVLPFSP